VRTTSASAPQYQVVENFFGKLGHVRIWRVQDSPRRFRYYLQLNEQPLRQVFETNIADAKRAARHLLGWKVR